MVCHLQAEISDQATANTGGRPVDSDQLLEITPQALKRRGFAVAKDLLGPFNLSTGVSFEHFFCEGFFAGEVVIEGPFWNIRLVEDLLHSGGCVAHGVYTPQPNLQEMIPCVPKFIFIYFYKFWHFVRPTSLFDAPY